MGQELIRRRDRHRPDFVQSQHRHPELPVSAQHEHDAVALLDPERGKVIRTACAAVHEIGEGERFLDRRIVADVDHGALIGLFGAKRVDHVKGEIESLGVLERDPGGRAVLVLTRLDEAAIDPFRARFADPFGNSGRFCARDRKFGNRFAGRIEDDGVEDAPLPLYGDHPVRNAAVVVHGVARVEDLAVFADLHLQGTLDNDVAFLSLVGGHFNVAMECFLVVVDLDIQRFGDPVHERMGKVIVRHAVRVVDLLPFSAPGERVSRQRRRFALDDVGDIHAEHECAPINKREIEVALAILAGKIFRLRRSGTRCHIRNRVALDLAQLPDSACHFFDLKRQSCDFAHVLYSFIWERGNRISLPISRIEFPRKTKSPPQRSCDLESLRRTIYPVRGTTQIVPKISTTPAPMKP